MAPPTADFHLYEEMDDSLCTGLGEATLGDQNTIPVIRYPNVVGLLPDTSIDADMIEFLEDPQRPWRLDHNDVFRVYNVL